MKLQKVIDNLNRTIEGKVALFDVLERHNPVVAKLVEVNIHELKKIRDDLLKVEA